MENQKYTIELDDKLIQAFKKEFEQLDGKDIYNKFHEFHKYINQVWEYLSTAKDLMYQDLAPDEDLDKHKEINIICSISFLLIKSTKTISKALQKYISFSNTLYKPMLQLGINEHLIYESDEATENEQGINELLEQLKPLYKYLNQKLKSNNKELDEKDKEIEKKRKDIKQKSAKLNKFITKVDKNSDYVKVYINLVKVSKKIPVSTSLAIASGDNEISKSTWDRILKNTAYLKIIRDELKKLISRTKNTERLEFYKIVYSKIDDKYNTNLLKEFDAKRIKKNKTISTYDDDLIPFAEHLQDKEEFDTFLRDEY